MVIIPSLRGTKGIIMINKIFLLASTKATPMAFHSAQYLLEDAGGWSLSLFLFELFFTIPSPSLARQTLTLIYFSSFRKNTLRENLAHCLYPFGFMLSGQSDSMENKITSRFFLFIQHVADEWRGFWEVDLPFGHLLLSKKQHPLAWLVFLSKVLSYIMHLSVTC